MTEHSVDVSMGSGEVAAHEDGSIELRASSIETALLVLAKMLSDQGKVMVRVKGDGSMGIVATLSIHEAPKPS
jgi:hypothetical protein